MFHRIFHVRFLLLPVAVLFGAMAVFGVARVYLGVAAVFLLAVDTLYYSSNDARIVYWLQTFRKIRRENPGIEVVRAKELLHLEFQHSPKYQPSCDVEFFRAHQLADLVTNMIRVEFRFEILDRITFMKRVSGVKAKTLLYMQTLGITNE